MWANLCLCRRCGGARCAGPRKSSIAPWAKLTSALGGTRRCAKFDGTRALTSTAQSPPILSNPCFIRPHRRPLLFSYGACIGPHSQVSMSFCFAVRFARTRRVRSRSASWSLTSSTSRQRPLPSGGRAGCVCAVACAWCSLTVCPLMASSIATVLTVKPHLVAAPPRHNIPLPWLRTVYHSSPNAHRTAEAQLRPPPPRPLLSLRRQAAPPPRPL